MHRQQENTASPFGERIELENYFVGGNFEEIIRDIHTAVQDRVPLIVLTGPEGSGKTMLCHLLHERQGNAYQALLFPKTVDSFEDVVRSIALHLDIFGENESPKLTVEQYLDDIIVQLKNSSVPLIILFDEAENIYLATLERIRKMVDRISGAGVQLPILFAGRSNFLENFQQLSICDFNAAEELHCTMTPLSETETADYLLHVSDKINENGRANIFTREVIEHIFQVAKGNFRMTNILAEEALQSHDDDTSFMVLLENVKEEVENDYEETSSFSLQSLIEEYRPYIPWGGGLLLVVVFLLMFFGAEDEPQPRLEGGKVELEIVQPEVRQEKKRLVESKQSPLVKPPPPSDSSLPVEKADAVEPLSEKTKDLRPIEVVGQPREVVESQVESLAITDSGTPVITKESNEKTIVVQPFEVVHEETPAHGLPVVTPENTPIVTESVEQIAKEDLEGKSVVAIAAVAKKQKKQDVVGGEQLIQVEDSIVELYPVSSMKQKPGSQYSDLAAANAQRGEQSGIYTVVNQLYKNRVAAGNSWRSGAKDQMFTVQLMVLTSKAAEKNLRDMLVEDRYRQEAGNFYIFKKDRDPENVMVFYGEYKTLTRARLAQNSLPQFLRDHKPYAISIKGAMAKVNK